MDQNQEFPIKEVISRMNKDATILGKQCFKSLMGNQPMAPWLTVFKQANGKKTKPGVITVELCAFGVDPVY